MRTLLDWTSDTASRAAPSGRQSTTASTPFSSSARAVGSLRRAGSMETTFRSRRSASRCRICRPVVPASPSMKIVWVMDLASRWCGPDKEKWRSGFPNRPSETRVFAASLLALRELEAASGLGLAVLLPLHDAAVAGQQDVRLQDWAERRP